MKCPYKRSFPYFIFDGFNNYMSDRKTIQINPDLFKVPEKKTRKREPKGSGTNPRLEMKTDLKRQKQKSLRKNVLKMIREKQQEEYKKLFGNKPPTAGESVSTSSPSSSTTSAQTLFNKDFDDSLDFFSSLAKKPENQETHDYTLKRYPNQHPNSVLLQPNMSVPSTTVSAATVSAATVGAVGTSMSPLIAHREQPIEMFSDTPYVVKPYIPAPPPTYGCLKNGTLPTYRTLKQRMYPSASATSSAAPSLMPMLSSSVSPIQPTAASMQPNIYNSVRPTTSYAPPSFMSAATGASSNLGTLGASEIAQKYQKQTEKTHLASNKNKIKYLKQKKIFKRTYRVGRSKVAPRIGVLVSNRTIRNRISTQSQLLKQTPIQEVRKFLIKKGFIKIGSNAPNNVLRKMYESVSLVCGEIENHNPDTLLFNFLNDSHP